MDSNAELVSPVGAKYVLGKRDSTEPVWPTDRKRARTTEWEMDSPCSLGIGKWWTDLTKGVDGPHIGGLQPEPDPFNGGENEAGAEGCGSNGKDGQGARVRDGWSQNRHAAIMASKSLGIGAADAHGRASGVEWGGIGCQRHDWGKGQRIGRDAGNGRCVGTEG